MEFTPVFDAVVADQQWNPLSEKIDETTPETAAADAVAGPAEDVADA